MELSLILYIYRRNTYQRASCARGGGACFATTSKHHKLSPSNVLTLVAGKHVNQLFRKTAGILSGTLASHP